MSAEDNYHPSNVDEIDYTVVTEHGDVTFGAGHEGYVPGLADAHARQDVTREDYAATAVERVRRIPAHIRGIVHGAVDIVRGLADQTIPVRDRAAAAGGLAMLGVGGQFGDVSHFISHQSLHAAGQNNPAHVLQVDADHPYMARLHESGNNDVQQPEVDGGFGPDPDGDGNLGGSIGVVGGVEDASRAEGASLEPQVCEDIKDVVPAAALNRAMANPDSVPGWGELEDSTRPAGADNPPKTWLELDHPEQAYNPATNGLEFGASCAVPSPDGDPDLDAMIHENILNNPEGVVLTTGGANPYDSSKYQRYQTLVIPGTPHDLGEKYDGYDIDVNIMPITAAQGGSENRVTNTSPVVGLETTHRFIDRSGNRFYRQGVMVFRNEGTGRWQLSDNTSSEFMGQRDLCDGGKGDSVDSLTAPDAHITLLARGASLQQPENEEVFAKVDTAEGTCSETVVFSDLNPQTVVVERSSYGFIDLPPHTGGFTVRRIDGLSSEPAPDLTLRYPRLTAARIYSEAGTQLDAALTFAPSTVGPYTWADMFFQDPASWQLLKGKYLRGLSVDPFDIYEDVTPRMTPLTLYAAIARQQGFGFYTTTDVNSGLERHPRAIGTLAAHWDEGGNAGAIRTYAAGSFERFMNTFKGNGFLGLELAFAANAAARRSASQGPKPEFEPVYEPGWNRMPTSHIEALAKGTLVDYPAQPLFYEQGGVLIPYPGQPDLTANNLKIMGRLNKFADQTTLVLPVDLGAIGGEPASGWEQKAAKTIAGMHAADFLGVNVPIYSPNGLGEVDPTKGKRVIQGVLRIPELQRVGIGPLSRTDTVPSILSDGDVVKAMQAAAVAR